MPPFPSCEDSRERCRKDYLTENLHIGSLVYPTDIKQHWRYHLHAGHGIHEDRHIGTERYKEYLRHLAYSEPEDHERNPCDRRYRAKELEDRGNKCVDLSAPSHGKPEREADERREEHRKEDSPQG